MKGGDSPPETGAFPSTEASVPNDQDVDSVGVYLTQNVDTYADYVSKAGAEVVTYPDMPLYVKVVPAGTIIVWGGTISKLALMDGALASCPRGQMCY